MEPVLTQAYGYGFAVGLGAAFALLMGFITRVLSKYLGQTQNSERFSTASRSVKSGLIASSTVSAWTWPATLLSSGAWSYSHGISGGFLYGIGGTFQITLFLFLAIQLKKKAPSAHTVSECFYIRFGKAGHWCFLVYCISNNVISAACMLLGGSQGFAATTGMHVVAASFLLPMNVVAYTALGGLKATFVSDWIHTVIIFGVLLATCYTIYCSSPLIGSPGKMYDLLQEVQAVFPSETGQSYLSFHDKSMILLAWSVAIGALSSVFGDPGYSQRAIAADSSSVFEGYLMGGLCWYIIPFALGSSGGLATRALLTNPKSVTYPNALTQEEVNSGLPVIYAMTSLWGKSGAAAGLVTLFMSVTSSTSAELIAFSSVSTYDIYRTYINPNASGKQLVRMAHMTVCGFGLFTAVLATVFNYIGVTVGWLISFLGIILTPSVSAVTYTLFWPKMTKLSLVIGCPLATLTGIAAWIAGTYCYSNGIIDKDTLNGSTATFIGNISALMSAAIYIPVISFIKLDKEPFDMSKLNSEMTVGDDVDKEGKEALIVTESIDKLLNRQSFLTILINIFLFFGIYIVLCVSLYGIKKDFSKSSFVGLMIVMLIWLVVAAAYIIVYPLWQGRFSIAKLVRLMLGMDHMVEEKSEVEDLSQGGSLSEAPDSVVEVVYSAKK
ncbi:hypothetical protein CANTEDRAFT_121979 [Yamadazyma tenuis ATCC 10573]|uniref:Urea active transporter n=1 Tax=Candida tenuis (strain ATCC 10573 / BCRC 21748 / CBS 615 / JCM 9827 / NBRC 10315 / NRRL Y-1498 / VKM Y-70) TaxID=590646 RepID=G3B4W4_CANTC|nr:uncharacterized protein CANTEDRAFT_121979 [Yamadazyma tenuis ATCC 10573]EGV64003.1 hypothetical protein CANTEDRAFT_121979 [Yamadazyma tenuis ATCC 10573]